MQEKTIEEMLVHLSRTFNTNAQINLTSNDLFYVSIKGVEISENGFLKGFGIYKGTVEEAVRETYDFLTNGVKIVKDAYGERSEFIFDFEIKDFVRVM